MKKANMTPADQGIAAATRDNQAAAKLKKILTDYEITEHLKIEQITGAIRRGSQGIFYDSILKVTHFSPPQDVTKKVKINIERDSYNSQSLAKISVWSAATESWNEVARLRPENSPVFDKINIYEDDPGLVSAERRMKIVAGTLLNTAAQVIF